jgi:hypothetical protein
MRVENEAPSKNVPVIVCHTEREPCQLPERSDCHQCANEDCFFSGHRLKLGVENKGSATPSGKGMLDKVRFQQR